MTQQLVSRWTIEDGRRMHTRVARASGAQGQLPIWCVHGLSVSSRYMVPTARILACSRTVYAPDLPGFGRGAKPPAILDVPGLADSLVRRMDAFGVFQAAMLGNSMGCQIIADLAVRFPERVAAAVFVGPTMDTSALSAPAQAFRLLRDARYESLFSILTQSFDYLVCGPRRTLATLRHALADPFEAKLGAVTMPTLVIRGEHDPIAPQRWCEQVARLLPHGTFAQIPNAPHALNYDQPVALASAVLAFLGEQVTDARLQASANS